MISVKTGDHETEEAEVEAKDEDSGVDAHGDTESSSMMPLMRLYTAAGNRL